MLNLPEFRDIYSRFLDSGLTVRDFCHNECMNEAKFYYWQKKLKSESCTTPVVSGFVPLVVHPNHPVKKESPQDLSFPSAGEESYFELVYPNGVKLHLGANFNLRLLKSLIFLSE